MQHRIADLLARVRALFTRRTPRQDSPAPAEPPRHACGVHAWATARGIEIRPSSPLASCTCCTHDPLPRVGAFVIDLRTNRVGQVMGDEGLYLQLRPPLGGREWDVDPGDTRPATDAELLSAKLKAANSASSSGR
ncbi:hypothetical protein [Streptomyces sp. NPDC002537]